MISNVYISGVNFEFFPPKREVLWTESVLSWFTVITVQKYKKNLRQSLICGEISKFDTWNIDIWGHVSLRLGGETSTFDTWNIDVWCQLKTCFLRERSQVDASDGKQQSCTYRPTLWLVNIHQINCLASLFFLQEPMK